MKEEGVFTHCRFYLVTVKTFISNSISLILALILEQDNGKTLNLYNQNYRNSKSSCDIDMKLGPLTKLDKRNKTISEKK